MFFYYVVHILPNHYTHKDYIPIPEPLPAICNPWQPNPKPPYLAHSLTLLFSGVGQFPFTPIHI